MTQSSPPQPSPSGPEDPWTVRRLLDWIRKYLGEKDVDSPRVCAELLLGHVLGCERLRLYMTPEAEPTPQQLADLRALVARAAEHEPVQYLVGSWPFHGREFEVGPCTLIPRPATELLVDRALDEIRSKGIHRDWKLLDLCTGSGCIGVSLLATLNAARKGPISERHQSADPARQSIEAEVLVAEEVELDLELQPVPTTGASASIDSDGSSPEQVQPEPGALDLIATDIVPEALELAGRNAARHGVSEFLQLRSGSLWDPLEQGERGAFDIICSNPPYVSDSEYDALDRNVREFEPQQALRGGRDGLDLVRRILQDAPDWLQPGGLLLVEVGAHTAEQALQEAHALARFESLDLQNDHEGFPRMLVLRT